MVLKADNYLEGCVSALEGKVKKSLCSQKKIYSGVLNIMKTIMKVLKANTYYSK